MLKLAGLSLEAFIEASIPHAGGAEKMATIFVHPAVVQQEAFRPIERQSPPLAAGTEIHESILKHSLTVSEDGSLSFYIEENLQLSTLTFVVKAEKAAYQGMQVRIVLYTVSETSDGHASTGGRQERFSFEKSFEREGNHYYAEYPLDRTIELDKHWTFDYRIIPQS